MSPSGFSVTICHMQMALRARHHDHDYVEKQGGWPLYTYLRSAGSRSEFRAGAIERSWDAYRHAKARSKPSAELGGLGLIVLQRAFLGLEDLGRLLYAYAGAEPWIALRHAKLDDLDQAFADAAEDAEGPMQRLGLIDPSQLAEEDLSKAAQAAALRLREITAREWSAEIFRGAGLWLTHRALARATMHGFPIIAGDLISEPPGAGELGEGLEIPETRPFAVALVSRVADHHVTTERHTVTLDHVAVVRVRNIGLGAARLCGQLAELKAEAVHTGHGGAVPFRFLSRLNENERRALEAEARSRETRGGS